MKLIFSSKKIFYKAAIIAMCGALSLSMLTSCSSSSGGDDPSEPTGQGTPTGQKNPTGSETQYASEKNYDYNEMISNLGTASLSQTSKTGTIYCYGATGSTDLYTITAVTGEKIALSMDGVQEPIVLKLDGAEALFFEPNKTYSFRVSRKNYELVTGTSLTEKITVKEKKPAFSRNFQYDSKNSLNDHYYLYKSNDTEGVPCLIITDKNKVYISDRTVYSKLKNSTTGEDATKLEANKEYSARLSYGDVMVITGSDISSEITIENVKEVKSEESCYYMQTIIYKNVYTYEPLPSENTKFTQIGIYNNALNSYKKYACVYIDKGIDEGNFVNDQIIENFDSRLMKITRSSDTDVSSYVNDFTPSEDCVYVFVYKEKTYYFINYRDTKGTGLSSAICFPSE